MEASSSLISTTKELYGTSKITHTMTGETALIDEVNDGENQADSL